MDFEDFEFIIVIFFIVLILGLPFIGFPIYKVWSKGLSGKADLREAEWNKKIAIEEAKAERDSALLKKESEIIRAEGIAEANRIIDQSISSNYIKYKFVEGLNDGNTEVIYVPTEANLPILEAREKN